MAIRCFSRASVPLAAAGAALALVPAGAAAQAVAANAASLSWSKTEAILGGPSALQAVLAQQHAIAAAPAIAPASYSVPRPVQAVVRTPAPDDGALSGRPDVFGSVALKVTHTPLDARWRAAEQMAVTGSPARFAAALEPFSAVEQLRIVNRYVNHRVRYEEDWRRFGRADVWSSANETLRSGRGDCEDYAIAKFQLLRSAGFAQRNLYLVIVRDLVRRADHAVLVARAGGHMFVLDDGTDDLLDSASVGDYRPVLTFASYGEWTHGYRVQRAPVYISENSATPMTLAAADQRSRSASLLAFNTGFSK
jgi:predicted transglutaminase-like cysteine proteinase